MIETYRELPVLEATLFEGDFSVWTDGSSGSVKIAMELNYPEWPELHPRSTSISSSTPRYRHPKSGTTSGPYPSLDAACEVCGVCTPAQYKAILIVMKVQYHAFQLHWSQQSNMSAVVPKVPIVYISSCVFRLSGSDFVYVAKGYSPILPQTHWAADQHLFVEHALRALVLMADAKASTAGFPPRSPGFTSISLSGVPEHTF